MLCSHCGATYTVGVNAACRDCRLALGDVKPPTLPETEDGGLYEVAFDMSEWLPEERIEAGLTLTSERVPWRWEEGPVLVVREDDEVLVDDLLGKEEGEGDAWEEEAADLEDGGEEAQVAMSDLFDAADRLMRAPWNDELVAEVGALAELVASLPPPFGVSRPVWDTIASRAAAVTAAAALTDGDDTGDGTGEGDGDDTGEGDGEDDDVELPVEGAARELRAYLRDLI